LTKFAKPRFVGYPGSGLAAASAFIRLLLKQAFPSAKVKARRDSEPSTMFHSEIFPKILAGRYERPTSCALVMAGSLRVCCRSGSSDGHSPFLL